MGNLSEWQKQASPIWWNPDLCREWLSHEGVENNDGP